MLKAIIFDLGGTLMSFGDPEMSFRELEAVGLHALYGAMTKMAGAPLPQEAAFVARLEELIHESWQRAQTTYNGECLDSVMAGALREWSWPTDEAFITSVLRTYHHRMEPYIRLYDDSLATLDALRARGLRIGLISNTLWTAEMHDRDLERCGILGHFHHRLYSSAHGRVKPHPDIFRASLRALDVAPDQALFVGDRIVDDVGGAQGAGLRAVLKEPPDRTEPHPEVTPDARIRTLSELLELVERF